jgi:hypothetical protein
VIIGERNCFVQCWRGSKGRIFEMPKEHENTQSSQRGREADRALAKGFGPLGLPAVAAAAKAMSRRPESSQPPTTRRQQSEPDDG